jgi:hypothetical protein
MKLIPLLALASTLACSGDKDHSDDTGNVHTGDTESDTDIVPAEYAFESALVPGESSVSYSGQVARQLLMADMKAAIGGLTDTIDANPNQFGTPGIVQDYLAGVYYTGDLLDGASEHMLSFSAEAEQLTFDEVSSGKNLKDKTAGNDTVTDHKDWSTEFVGWDHTSVTSPESLVMHFLGQLDDNVVTYATGGDLTGIDGSTVDKLYLTTEGTDLQQLLQKFLGVAVAFSQGADDYMDDDVDGKGLNADHVSPAKEGSTYTALEHAWDEGFGYFGAARAYGSWTDDENEAAASGYDTDGNGLIDLKSEVNWGHSVNAAKRDLGAVAATDFTADAWEGFAMGRQLLSDTAGSALTSAEFAKLQGYRDLAIGAWEKAISSTVVHYINDVLQDLNGTEVDAAGLAKHWSELKGFALAFQFNPNSPMSDADFAQLHSLLGTGPSLDASYKGDLLTARGLVRDAYSFDNSNMGDDNGEGGW